ncbi:MAG: phage portal protein [Candidatus Ornithomonoglobus sp.]
MQLTIAQISKKIAKFESRVFPRLNRLFGYYIGNHGILDVTKGKGKPNNKLVTNYAKNIVTNTQGYFMGVPVTYKSSDAELEERIQDIIEYNDDAAVNSDLAEDLSIYGIAAELLYIDADAQIRYTEIDPKHLYIETSQNVNDEIILAIRWYDVYDDDDICTRHIEVYDAETITYYMTKGKRGGAIVPEVPEGTASNVVRHYWGAVPINVYYNNKNHMGDFEDIISLQDAYNTMESESVNDYQSFADAILLLKNTKMPTEIDPVTGKQKKTDFRDTKVLSVYDEGDASYLVKQVNDTYVENIKERIREDIYLTSNTVNMSDENFAANASGVSIIYKLMNFENRVAKTERRFTKGLQRRFELICTILNIKAGPYDYRDITFNYTRNIPANVSELVTEVLQLDGIVSLKTRLALLPFINDPEDEIKQLEKEQKSQMQYNLSSFGRTDTRDNEPDDEDIDSGRGE